MRIELMPDWQSTWTAVRAEEQLEGFKFLGTGWYVTKDCTILVMPVTSEAVVWRQTWPVEQLFRFLVYSNRDPRTDFNTITSAPVRHECQEQCIGA